jgi:hypothetical protein
MVFMWLFALAVALTLLTGGHPATVIVLAIFVGLITYLEEKRNA